MEDQEEPTTPFWATHRRRPPPPIFFNSGVLLFTLCITLSLFIYYIFPTLFLSLRPTLFKKSWESLNITLVLLALLFGFLSRNINHDGSINEVVKSSGSTPRGWFDYPEDRTGLVGLRRCYSSYPDLREISPREDIGERWQFYDDTSLARAPRVTAVRPGVKTGTRFDDDTPLVRDTCVPTVESISSRDVGDRWRIYDDTSLATRANEGTVQPVESTGMVSRIGDGVARSALAKPIGDLGSESRLVESRCSTAGEYVNRKRNESCASVLPKERIIEQVHEDKATLQAPTVRSRTHRTAHNVPNNEESTNQVSSSEKVTITTDGKEEAKTTSIVDSNRYELSPPRRSERKRGGNATKHFIDSFRKKKKKQRQKSVENFETLIGSHPPPPPPLPPPRNFFSSKKSKKIIIVPLPPPPPPLPTFFTSQAQKSAAVVAPTKATTVLHRPFLPVQNGGGESPMRQIPPPPPLPPFKMKSWKFVVKGDYVKIGSMSSDEMNSPTSSESGETPTTMDAREAGKGPMFCPSPDVNSKADMFIAKFRAGLKLQKMNSMNLKQGLGLSNLGTATKT